MKLNWRAVSRSGVLAGLLAGCGHQTLGADEDSSDGPGANDDAAGSDGPADPNEDRRTVGEFCNARASDCPRTHECCSDDPAAWNGALPAYRDDIPNADVPLFSAQNNDYSSSGMCVRLDDVPCGSGLGQPDGSGGCTPGCPIPCNPTWSASSIEAVCKGLVCCQTRPIEPEDCVLDGDVWRPITGEDVPEKSQWRPADHATHQDPGGRACAEITGSNDVSDPAFRSCVDQLGVADQRGYCMPSCPDFVPAGPDACERLNAR
jgi:hypothetical protein